MKYKKSFPGKITRRNSINQIIRSDKIRISIIRNQINIDGKRILKRKEELKQWEINVENNSFKTLKEHRETFNSNPSVSFINLLKKKLTCIRSAILDTAKQKHTGSYYFESREKLK